MDEKGVVHREVELVPLTGREEELLAQNRKKESATMVTTVISRCVKRLGTIEPVSETAVRSMLIADRQFLLLKLREITFGDKVHFTVSCPWPDCKKQVDVEFSIRDISVKESKPPGLCHTMELSEKAAIRNGDGESYKKITYRLPNGSDQESVSPMLHENEAKALTQLLERCILAIGPRQNPGKDLLDMISPLARMEIETHMAATAPCLDLDLETDCPECEREFTVPFDLHHFFFGELRTSLGLLYREVHYLAYHYHWSEDEIMTMTREKRHNYIDVLADEIERMNNAI